jgi:gamma-glutamyl-gamma-aminobutyrate hydrolase PuuD
MYRSNKFIASSGSSPVKKKGYFGSGEIITIAELLPLIHNSLAKISSTMFDLGDFLQQNGYRRDLSQITPEKLDECLSCWPTVNEQLEHDDTIGWLFEQEEAKPAPIFDVSNKGFNNLTFISKSELKLLVQDLFHNKSLLSIILPSFAVNSMFVYKDCIIRDCVLSRPTSQPETSELQFKKCNISNMQISDIEAISLISCTGENLQLNKSSKLYIYDCNILYLTVHDCVFSSGVKLLNSQLHFSCFKANAFYSLFIHDVTGLNSQHCQDNLFLDRDDILNAGCGWDFELNHNIKTEDSTPNIAVSYCFNNAATTDTLLDPYISRQKKDRNGGRIIYLDNQKPFASMIEDLNKLRINLVILAGGENVPQEYYIPPTIYKNPDVPIPNTHKRTNFELNLLRWAESKKIDAIGICRGLQVMGVYSGMQLMNLDDAVSHCHEQKMIVNNEKKYSSNILYEECERKYMKHTNSFRKYCTPLFDNERKLLSFVVKRKCFHSQSIDPNSVNELINVTAQSEDNIIESAQFTSTLGSLLLGLQSHPERIYSEDKMAKALFKYSIKIAKKNMATTTAYHRTRVQRAISDYSSDNKVPELQSNLSQCKIVFL